MQPLPVLMYHGLHVDAQSRGRFDPVYSVHPEAFTAQLDWLRDNGYRSVAIGRDQRVADGHLPVAITFDDGDVSNREVALPLLATRGMTAEFFVTSDFIDQPGMLAAADVRWLADAGMGIGAHGKTHAFLEDLDVDALAAELHDSRSRLSGIIGRPVDTLALPGGRGGDRELRAAIENGFSHLYGSVPGPNRRRQGDIWQQRLAITRDTTLAGFADLVRWRGFAPRLARARFSALRLPKRILGNARYEQLRTKLL